jgi:hypothetical protein
MGDYLLQGCADTAKCVKLVWKYALSLQNCQEIVELRVKYGRIIAFSWEYSRSLSEKTRHSYHSC